MDYRWQKGRSGRAAVGMEAFWRKGHWAVLERWVEQWS